MQSKNWCFTLQASSEEDRVTWAAPGAPCPLGKWCEAGHFSYMVCQLEKAPETGQLHLQGYIQFTQNKRLSFVKKLNDKAHWETRKASHEAARDYCKKADTRVNGPWELGEELVPKQGKRTDWAEVSTKISQGCTKKQILQDHPHLAPCARGIDALIDAHRKDPPLMRDMDIWYLYGPTNTGKTHRAMTTFPKAYVTKGKYFEGKTFDRYEGQEVLIMDEWSPYEWDLTLMNGLLDKWPCPLQCRYQNKDACWTKVIILSNFKPEECYPASNLLQRGTFDRRLAHKVRSRTSWTPSWTSGWVQLYLLLLRLLLLLANSPRTRATASCSLPLLTLLGGFLLLPGPDKTTPPLKHNTKMMPTYVTQTSGQMNKNNKSL